MSSSRDEASRHFYLSLEVEFLDSVTKSESAIETFADRLLHLQDDAHEGLQTTVSNVALIHDTATRLQILSESFIDIETKSTQVEENLLHDIDNFLQQLSLEDASTEG